MKRFSSKSQAGDTIVEVLISVAILAVVMVATYVSSNQSLRNGTDSSNRQQALALANQQIELIRNQPPCDTSPPPFCTGTFSIKGSGAATSNSYTPAGSVFTISDTFQGGGNPTYTITATWPGPSSQNSQLQIFYRTE